MQQLAQLMTHQFKQLHSQIEQQAAETRAVYEERLAAIALGAGGREVAALRILAELLPEPHDAPRGIGGGFLRARLVRDDRDVARDRVPPLGPGDVEVGLERAASRLTVSEILRDMRCTTGGDVCSASAV